MHYDRVVCLDMEMCCWEDSNLLGEILEIGLVEISLKEEKVIRKNQYYVKNEKDDISEYCTSINHISQKIINKQGRTLKEVIKSIEKKYGTNKIFISYGNDFEYLKKQCIKKNIDFNFKHSLNFSILYNIKNAEILNGGMSISQSKAMNIEKIEKIGTEHTAISDAENLSRLVFNFFKETIV